MYNLFILSIVTSLFAFINATPVSQDAIILPLYSIPPSFPAECHGQKILKQTYIGEFNNVLASYYTCSGTCSDTRPATTFTSPTLKTTTDQCGVPCTTTCFTPAGGGPDPRDCTVIADALLFESQNKGPNFNIGIGATNFVKLTYSSCSTMFVNKQTTTMTYCRNDWAGVVGFIAPNCQATQNARGGICVTKDQAFFIQVNHS